ncbi:Crp/Fnr family transcriptional regulator [uncultured Mailhella sp.]|uniref:Crp/Fnr family transcriptional regulator n=1 Tax=uncultured Mailhella sp. TaxID=1981031 RepID=UPI002635BD6E|nr:Crp/Fnr family transcriptional regulator [uncultured Mailhella sp.]
MLSFTPQDVNLSIPCYIKNTSCCWEQILNIGRKEKYPKGATFFESSYGQNRFFYVKSGLLCTINENDHEKIHFFFDSGSLLRETIFLSNYTLPQNYYYYCIKNLIIYSFDGALLLDRHFYANYPELIMNCMFSISIKSLMSQLFSNIISLKSKEAQVAFYIDHMFRSAHERAMFIPPINQSQLASLLGLHKNTVSRIINNLKKKRLLGCYTKTRLEILDVEGIRRLYPSSLGEIFPF